MNTSTGKIYLGDDIVCHDLDNLSEDQIDKIVMNDTAYVSSTAPTSTRPVRQPWVVELDGISDHLTSANATTYGEKIVYAAWVKRTKVDSQPQYVVSCSLNSNNGNFEAFGVHSDGRLMYRSSKSSSSKLSFSSGVITSNVWTHICIVKASSTSRRFYINGVFDSEDTASMPTADNLRVHRYGSTADLSPQDFWGGSLMHIFSANGIDFSDQQVLDLYNGLGYDLANQGAFLGLNQESGTRGIDSSGNAQDATLVGASFVVDTTIPLITDRPNLIGYTDNAGDIIPRDESDITNDADGNALQYSGNVYPVYLDPAAVNVDVLNIAEGGNPSAASAAGGRDSSSATIKMVDDNSSLQALTPTDSIYRRDNGLDRLLAFSGTLTGSDKIRAERYTNSSAEFIDVYISGGQSNSLVSAGFYGSGTVPDVQCYYDTDDDDNTGDAFSGLLSANTSGKFGANLQFAKDVAGTTTDFGLIHYGRSGTGFKGGSGNNWRAGGTQRLNFFTTLNLGITDIEVATGKKVRVSGLLWTHGERDARFDNADYAADFRSFVNEIRVSHPLCNVVIYKLSNNQTDINSPRRDLINDAIDNMVDSNHADFISNLQFIETDGLSVKADNLHYNDSALESIGSQAATLLGY